MKKTFKIFLPLVVALLAFTASAKLGLALADEGWRITDFRSQIWVEKAGTILIEERINVNFGGLEKHGIFRVIPYIYDDNSKKVFISVDVLGVNIGEEKTPYTISKSNGYITIKIGDLNRLISGIQNYGITYRVAGILKSFENFDELYWNVTGNDWPVLIEKSSASVYLPVNGQKSAILQKNCYIGIRGSTENCRQTTTPDVNIAGFSTGRLLAVGEGLTVAVGFEKNIVPIITANAPKNPFRPKEIIGAALIVFILGFLGAVILWWKRGRDLWWHRKSLHDENQYIERLPFFAKETIVAEYESPQNPSESSASLRTRLRPAEIGVIIDESADADDITATIVDLAVRGYLTITEIPKSWLLGSVDYELKKTGKSFDDLLPYEKKLVQSLFNKKELGKILSAVFVKKSQEAVNEAASESRESVKISKAKAWLHQDFEEIKKKIYERAVELGAFSKNPKSTRIKYSIIAIAIIGAGIGAIFLSAEIFNNMMLGAGIGLLAGGFVWLIFAQFMSRKTADGRELYRQIKGYKLFLSNVEKYRQPFFEKQNLFMDVLPYAIVFGVTKKLATAMKNMGVTPPAPVWYHGGASAFNIESFGSNIQSFSNSFSAAVAPKGSGSGSHGGGFSGGGFGGGGGGSW